MKTLFAFTLIFLLSMSTTSGRRLPRRPQLEGDIENIDDVIDDDIEISTKKGIFDSKTEDIDDDDIDEDIESATNALEIEVEIIRGFNESDVELKANSPDVENKSETNSTDIAVETTSSTPKDESNMTSSATENEMISTSVTTDVTSSATNVESETTTESETTSSETGVESMTNEIEIKKEGSESDLNPSGEKSMSGHLIPVRNFAESDDEDKSLREDNPDVTTGSTTSEKPTDASGNSTSTPKSGANTLNGNGFAVHLIFYSMVYKIVCKLF